MYTQERVLIGGCKRESRLLSVYLFLYLIYIARCEICDVHYRHRYNLNKHKNTDLHRDNMQKAIKEEVNGLQQAFKDIDKEMDFESQTPMQPNAQEVRARTQDEKTQIIEYI